jgi:hypothetical protein
MPVYFIVECGNLSKALKICRASGPARTSLLCFALIDNFATKHLRS